MLLSEKIAYTIGPSPEKEEFANLIKISIYLISNANIVQFQVKRPRHFRGKFITF